MKKIHRGDTPSDLYDPARVAATAAGHLTYRGGPVLSAARVVPAFSAGYAPELQAGIAAFLEWFVGADGPMVAQLAEYATVSHPIGAGSVAPAINFPWKPRSVVSDTTIRRHLRLAVDDGTLEAPTPNSVYCVYLPSGTAVSEGGSRSCQVFCGYHDHTGGSPDLYYAVLPYPDCDGCMGGLSVLDALTSVTSHEVSEAVTDPVPATGWYDDRNGEIGDICAWRQDMGPDGQVYQQEWSNRAGACI